MRTKHTFNPFIFLASLCLAAASDGGAGAGGGSGTDNGSGGNAGGAAGGEQTVTMKQSDLDTKFAERATRASEKAKADLLAELGVKTPEEAKVKLKAQADAEAAQLTELQKAQKDAADALAAKQQAETAAADVLKKANERLMRGAVLALAGQFHNPEDAWTKVDRSKIKVNEAGEVEGAKEAVEAVASDKVNAYLLKGTQTPTPRGTPRPAGTKTSGGNGNQPETPRKSRLKF